MEITFLSVGLIVLSIVVIIGLVRIFTNPYTNFGDILLQVFCLDLFFDFLKIILENIGDIDL